MESNEENDGHWGTIGESEVGRPLWLKLVGRTDAPLRILILAGQHGDETLAMDVVNKLASPAGNPRMPDVQCAFLPCLNPDGCVLGTRANLHGVDLNRDHLLLSAAETDALHHFVRSWRPHLVLDVHTFEPRRRHLLKQNLIYYHDVMLDVPNHPALSLPILQKGAATLLSPLLTSLRRAGISAERYTLINRTRADKSGDLTPGRVRHSTPDIVDARNGLALRYGLMSILIEGRQPLRREGAAGRQRVQSALVATIRIIAEWAQMHREQLISHASHEPIRSIPIDYRYLPAAPRSMRFTDRRTHRVRTVELPGKYTPTVEPTAWVLLPKAYAIPRRLDVLLAVLARQGVERCTPPAGAHKIERYRIDRCVPSLRARRTPRTLELSIETDTIDLSEYLFIPMEQNARVAVVTWLEPQSKCGLSRFEEAGLPLESGTEFPILRVLGRASA